MAELETDEIEFLNEYFTNGFSCSRAYKKVHPLVTDRSAYELGRLALKKLVKTEYYKARIADTVMEKDEYLRILSEMARKKNKTALVLLGKVYIPTKIEGNVNHSISWADFINGNSDPETDRG